MPVMFRPGLAGQAIAAVEQALGLCLPADYRDFLGYRNGIYIEAPDYGELELRAVTEEVIAFDRLFGVDEEHACNDLLLVNQELADELDFLPGVLLIGEDGGGNPYVLLTQGAISGVYYWDRTHLHHELPGERQGIAEVEDCGNLFRLTHSFSEFYRLIEASQGCQLRYLPAKSQAELDGAGDA